MRVQIHKEEGIGRGGAGSEGTDTQRGRDRKWRTSNHRVVLRRDNKHKVSKLTTDLFCLTVSITSQTCLLDSGSVQQSDTQTVTLYTITQVGMATYLGQWLAHPR